MALFLIVVDGPKYLESYLDWIHVKRELDYEYDAFEEKNIDALMLCLESGKDLKFRDRYKE